MSTHFFREAVESIQLQNLQMLLLIVPVEVGGRVVMASPGEVTKGTKTANNTCLGSFAPRHSGVFQARIPV